jgi:hypothetical protein
MAYKTTYSALKVLDLIFGGQAFTPPATLYWTLTTTVPTKAAAGTPVAWTGYARVAQTNNLTNWPSAEPKVNATAVTWPAVPASTGSRVIVGIEIYDALTGGNRLAWAAVTSRTITDGDIYQVAAGMVSATEV